MCPPPPSRTTSAAPARRRLHAPETNLAATPAQRGLPPREPRVPDAYVRAAVHNDRGAGCWVPEAPRAGFLDPVGRRPAKRPMNSTCFFADVQRRPVGAARFAEASWRSGGGWGTSESARSARGASSRDAMRLLRLGSSGCHRHSFRASGGRDQPRPWHRPGSLSMCARRLGTNISRPRRDYERNPSQNGCDFVSPRRTASRPPARSDAPCAPTSGEP